MHHQPYMYTHTQQQRELRPLCALKGGESYTAVSDTAILIDIPMPKVRPTYCLC